MDPLATPADIEEYAPGLGMPSTRAAKLITIATGLIRSYCGWHIAPVETDATVTVDGSGASIQQLPTLHLTDVSLVVEDDVTVDLAGVQWTEAGYLWRPAPWTRKLRGVAATISHGHETVPDDILGVVCSAVARAAPSPTGETREQTGPFSVTRSQVAPGVAGGVVLLDHEKRILDPYVIPVRT